MNTLSKQRCLVIDTSSQTTFVGICHEDTWLSLQRSEEPALESLFILLDKVFEGASLERSDIDAILYCAGPGSTLGVRLACMTLRAWKSIGLFKNTPTYSYLSLPLTAAIAEIKHEPNHPFYVITELRKNAWNLLTVSKPATLGTIEEASELPDPAGRYFYFPQRRRNPDLPESTTEAAYSIEQLPTVIDHPSLFILTDTPAPWDIKEPTYAKWSAERHR